MTSDEIFVLDAAGKLTPLHVEPYDSEARLQQMLEDHPDLLAGGQMNPVSPLRWLHVAREVGVPAAPNSADQWSIDHVFVDQDAIPTLVEVKRSSDTRIRREVVGQMLDYAANCVLHWPQGRLRSEYERTNAATPEEADASVEDFCDGKTADEFWQIVDDHLRVGRIRLVFIADKIPRELRRIVEFLNEQMSRVDVVAVEVAQYVGGDLRTLVPRVVGVTATSEAVKGRQQQRSYDEWLALVPEANRTVEGLLVSWAAENGVETRRRPQSLQLLAAPGRPMSTFYPQYEAFDIALDPLRRRGLDTEADEILASITRVIGKEPKPKYPNVPSTLAAQQWGTVVETVLAPTLVAYRRAGDPDPGGSYGAP